MKPNSPVSTLEQKNEVKYMTYVDNLSDILLSSL